MNFSQARAKAGWSLLLAIAIPLLLSATLFGQAISGDLVGTVTDTSGAVIPKATVNAQNVDANITASGSGVLNLALLQAGVGTSGGLGAGSGPAVGGQRPRNNNFTIDGIDNNDKGVTGPVFNVPNDAVQELTILQNQYSPEFGHSN